MARFRAYSPQFKDSRSTPPPKKSSSSKANARVAELVVKKKATVSSASKLSRMLGKDGKGKSRGGLSPATKDRLKGTIKKGKRKQALKQQEGEWAFVFVGNLNPSINEEDLSRAFQHCGKITSITIRTSSGHIQIAKPGQYKYSSADRQYATIHFTDTRAAKRALRFNGKDINGRKIAVCFNAVDLPEMQHIIKEQLSQEPELSGKVHWKAYVNALKQVTSKQVTNERALDGDTNPKYSPTTDRRELKALPVKKEPTFPRTLM